MKVKGHRFHRGEGGLIVAANHQSWLDAYLVQWAVFPHRMTFLMTENYYDLPVAGLYFRAAGARPIREEGRPSVAALKAAYAAMEEGEMICLFPEGEITPTGKMQEGQRGVAHIARKMKVPVLPIGIRGAIDVWSRVQPKPRLTGRVELHVGEPIEYTHGTGREGDQAFTDALMAELRRLSGAEEESEGQGQGPGARS